VSLPRVAIERASGSVSEICLFLLFTISALITLSRAISSFSFAILSLNRSTFAYVARDAHGVGIGRQYPVFSIREIAVTYFEWSAQTDQKIIIPWRVIDGPETADAVANEIMNTPVRRGSRTSISGAIYFATRSGVRSVVCRTAVQGTAVGFGSKIGGDQVVGTPASANVDPGSGGTYQVTVGIERAEKTRFIGASIWLNAPQCVFVYKKRRLYRAIVSPKPHGMPRSVVRTAMIWKLNHWLESIRLSMRETSCRLAHDLRRGILGGHSLPHIKTTRCRAMR
jgi:Protein of unknown function (DUF1194)